MLEIITSIVIGLVLIVIGISNMKGNISALHSYHIKRVKKEDMIPFGKKIGLGTIIIGCTLIIVGVLDLFVNKTIHTIILSAGLIPGLVIIFYALFKYNKGIF